MSLTTLKTEVQARIDALVVPTQASEVDATLILQSAVDTVGLDLDLTNIIAVHTAAMSFVDGTTTDDDLTTLNAASIALGVTSKNSGDNIIGSLKPFVVSTPNFIEEGGYSWLKTGELLSNLNDFPDDAPTSVYFEISNDTIFIDTSTEVVNTKAVTYSPTDNNYYVLDASDSDKCKIYKKTDGSYVGETLSLTAPTEVSGGIGGITIVGDKIWGVSGSSASTDIHIFNLDGSYVGVHGSNLPLQNVNAVSFCVNDDATMGFVLDASGNSIVVYKINLIDDNTTLDTFTVGSGYTPTGAFYYGGYLYALIQNVANSVIRIYKISILSNNAIEAEPYLMSGAGGMSPNNQSRYSMIFDGDKIVFSNRGVSGDGLSTITSGKGVGISTPIPLLDGTAMQYVRIG